MFIALDVCHWFLLCFHVGSVYVQVMLEYWRMWAEPWCYTDGPSCPLQSTLANARAPVTRQRCSNTAAWLARTVPKGSCSIAPETHSITPLHLLFYVNSQPSSIVCFCMSVCLLTVCESAFWCIPPVISPCWINSVATHCLLYIFTHSTTGLIISNVSFTFFFFEQSLNL